MNNFVGEGPVAQAALAKVRKVRWGRGMFGPHRSAFFFQPYHQAVLAELPKQVVQFFVSKNIIPPAAPKVPPASSAAGYPVGAPAYRAGMPAATAAGYPAAGYPAAPAAGYPAAAGAGGGYPAPPPYQP